MTATRFAALIALAAAALLVGLLTADSAAAQELEWSAAERDDLTLWHTQGQQRADTLADHAQGAYDLVSDLIGAELDSPLAIIVWPPGADPGDAAQLPDGVDERAQLRHVTSNASGQVRGSVTNALIDAAASPHAERVPFWMRAALGLWSAGPLPGFFLTRAGSVIIYDHEEFYTVEQLETVPTSWQFQAKYFGQVGGMLAWMIQDWGTESLEQLFATVAEGTPFYDSLEQVYGIPADRLIDEFTKNAERALLLNWPYIEPQSPPFYDRLNINHIIIAAAALPMAILFFFIGKRLFYD